MADPNKTLTELVKYVRAKEQRPYWSPVGTVQAHGARHRIDAAIKTAEEQIDTYLLNEITLHTRFLESQLNQQRERVEKVIDDLRYLQERLVKHGIVEHCPHCMIKMSINAPEIQETLEAALKELEAE